VTEIIFCIFYKRENMCVLSGHKTERGAYVAYLIEGSKSRNSIKERQLKQSLYKQVRLPSRVQNKNALALYCKEKNVGIILEIFD